jgi:hypothetical protein
MFSDLLTLFVMVDCTDEFFPAGVDCGDGSTCVDDFVTAGVDCGCVLFAASGEIGFFGGG